MNLWGGKSFVFSSYIFGESRKKSAKIGELKGKQTYFGVLCSLTGLSVAHASFKSYHVSSMKISTPVYKTESNLPKQSSFPVIFFCFLFRLEIWADFRRRIYRDLWQENKIFLRNRTVVLCGAMFLLPSALVLAYFSTALNNAHLAVPDPYTSILPPSLPPQFLSRHLSFSAHWENPKAFSKFLLRLNA